MTEPTKRTVHIEADVVQLKIDVRQPREVVIVCDRADGKEDNKRLVVNKQGRLQLQ